MGPRKRDPRVDKHNCLTGKYVAVESPGFCFYHCLHFTLKSHWIKTEIIIKPRVLIGSSAQKVQPSICSAKGNLQKLIAIGVLSRPVTEGQNRCLMRSSEGL